MQNRIYDMMEFVDPDGTIFKFFVVFSGFLLKPRDESKRTLVF